MSSLVAVVRDERCALFLKSLYSIELPVLPVARERVRDVQAREREDIERERGFAFERTEEHGCTEAAKTILHYLLLHVVNMILWVVNPTLNPEPDIHPGYTGTLDDRRR